MESRPYENNLKLLLMRRMADHGLSLEKAMVAYDWFDYYYSQGSTGQEAYGLVRNLVLRRDGLDQKPPSSDLTSHVRSMREEILHQLRNWLA